MGRRQHARRTGRAWTRAARLGAPAALALVLAGAAALAAAARAPGARAAPRTSCSPCLAWQFPSFPGQNNGNPWGPVGGNLQVAGTGFTPDASLTLDLVQGDPYATGGCATGGTVVTLDTGVMSGANGGFTYQFTWPADAGSPGPWSICASYNATHNEAGGGQSGPYTVLAGTAPGVSVSTTTAHPGDTVTVTGTNWVPENQTVEVGIGSPAIVQATATTSGHTAGTFGATLTIPANAAPGTYPVTAYVTAPAAHFLGVGPAYTPVVQVRPAPAATPAPTAAPGPSSTPASGGGQAPGAPAGTAVPVATGTGQPARAATPAATPAPSILGRLGGLLHGAGARARGAPAALLAPVIALAMLLLPALAILAVVVLRRGDEEGDGEGGGTDGDRPRRLLLPGPLPDAAGTRIAQRPSGGPAGGRVLTPARGGDARGNAPPR